MNKQQQACKPPLKTLKEHQNDKNIATEINLKQTPANVPNINHKTFTAET
jgi:hypothetical protein